MECLPEIFAPMLWRRGVDEDAVHQLLVENPARAFSQLVATTLHFPFSL